MHLFTDDELILKKLSKKGNPLDRLEQVVNWSQFQSILVDSFGKKDKNPAKGGRPHLDFRMMFKVLLLQRLYNLSDDAMEYPLLDRLSFCQFVGCHENQVPDAKTIWLYRDRLTKSGKEIDLFHQFYSRSTLKSNYFCR